MATVQSIFKKHNFNRRLAQKLAASIDELQQNEPAVWKRITLELTEDPEMQELLEGVELRWQELRHHFKRHLVLQLSRNKLLDNQQLIDRLQYPYLRKVYVVTIRFSELGSNIQQVINQKNRNPSVDKLFIKYLTNGQYDPEIVAAFKKRGKKGVRVYVNINVDDPQLGLSADEKKFLLQLGKPRERHKPTEPGVWIQTASGSVPTLPSSIILDGKPVQIEEVSSPTVRGSYQDLLEKESLLVNTQEYDNIIKESLEREMPPPPPTSCSDPVLAQTHRRTSESDSSQTYTDCIYLDPNEILSNTVSSTSLMSQDPLRLSQSIINFLEPRSQDSFVTPNQANVPIMIDDSTSPSITTNNDGTSATNVSEPLFPPSSGESAKSCTTDQPEVDSGSAQGVSEQPSFSSLETNEESHLLPIRSQPPTLLMMKVPVEETPSVLFSVKEEPLEVESGECLKETLAAEQYLTNSSVDQSNFERITSTSENCTTEPLKTTTSTAFVNQSVIGDTDTGMETANHQRKTDESSRETNRQNRSMSPGKISEHQHVIKTEKNHFEPNASKRSFPSHITNSGLSTGCVVANDRPNVDPSIITAIHQVAKFVDQNAPTKSIAKRLFQEIEPPALGVTDSLEANGEHTSLSNRSQPTTTFCTNKVHIGENLVTSIRVEQPLEADDSDRPDLTNPVVPTKAEVLSDESDYEFPMHIFDSSEDEDNVGEPDLNINTNKSSSSSMEPLQVDSSECLKVVKTNGEKSTIAYPNLTTTAISTKVEILSDESDYEFPMHIFDSTEDEESASESDFSRISNKSSSLLMEPLKADNSECLNLVNAMDERPTITFPNLTTTVEIISDQSDYEFPMHIFDSSEDEATTGESDLNRITNKSSSHILL
ncbi:uncharacterized protein LOC129750831 [Uranotaenia lowii]|uniref:uncharacterized protein LOC129750831 n=1 Tax=Uranotaenia lowii TaxID=190385 RepID=UPI0024795411|nr:uncharacterized protein LOC129750831 [Uranotaenia lowii]XP_055601888.1 uncharacterized protein LOC129750831 [Uranotaenia lowii]XP_055601889.1 uncharacterized protein LOC129750831 [Uranotaenia lowii]